MDSYDSLPITDVRRRTRFKLNAFRYSVKPSTEFGAISSANSDTCREFYRAVSLQMFPRYCLRACERESWIVEIALSRELMEKQWSKDLDFSLAVARWHERRSQVLLNINLTVEHGRKADRVFQKMTVRNLSDYFHPKNVILHIMARE